MKVTRFALVVGALLGWVVASQRGYAAVDSLQSIGRTTGPEDSIEASADAVGGGKHNPLVLNYTNVFYGPSLENRDSYQPQSDGTPDKSRPVFMKNFLSATYGLNETWAITATAYWWYRPVLGQQLSMQDPFIRLSNNSIFSTEWGLNLYGDVRVHMGVTPDSRDAGFSVGFQNFDYLTFQPNNGRFIFAMRASARGNVITPHGYGTDSEFYLAPEVNFRLNPKWALTALYEMGASHMHGDKPTFFTNDGTDLEAGVEWDPTNDIIVNPYVTMLPGGSLTLASTSVGMFFTWSFL